MEKRKRSFKNKGASLFLFRLVARDRDFDRGAAFFSGRNGEGSATHHLEPSADIVESDMRLVVIGGGKAGSVVLDEDLYCVVRFSRCDRNMNGSVALSHPVHDGVLHDGLQCQRRDAEHRDRRVETDEQTVLKLRLLHGEVGAGVFEFLREGDGLFARDGGEIFSEIGSKVQRDLLCLFWVLIA